MDTVEMARWLRYALAWLPTDVWDELKRDGDWPKVEEALAELERYDEAMR